MNDYVWYAAYGSNLNQERFSLYIAGGKAEYVDESYTGCSDKTPPVKVSAITIYNDLYFSQSSKIWKDGAIAFITTSEETYTTTLCRLYLIDKKQLVEIIQKENDSSEYDPHFNIDFELVQKKGFLLVGNDDEFQWYGKILYLGSKDKFPIFTFTAKWNDSEIIPAVPSEQYIITIVRGLLDGFELDDLQICQYLLKKRGIKNQFSSDQINLLVHKAKETQDARN